MVLASAAALAGCTSFGASGPSSRDIHAASDKSVEGAAVRIVDLDQAVGARLDAANRHTPFSTLFGDLPASGTVIGRGDQLSVQIWEAPPAVLFGTSARVAPSSATSMPNASSNTQSIESLLVDADGSVPIPFAGNVRAAGRTPQQIAEDIRNRLAGKAHDPQVVVTLAQNSTATVSVVGDVKNNSRVPLSPHGERILEVLAGAGGVDDRVDKAMIQITRDGRVASLPLTRIINEPSENIRLQPNDVVTALTKTLSFTVLGASGKNDEIEFEATGITLAQAMGRMGGLKDDRANIRGVFIFRLERPEVVGVTPGDGTPLTREGLVPVIYRIDTARPETLFLAQKFAVRDSDVLYVSTAPITDIQRFMQLLSSLVFPIIGLTQTVL
ncbi:polysaccharide export protein [Sphingomonas sp. NSE70-1]|uniref:Polysaccharide export protein n=1 Tax=Sphingomonas caseinilyticus TaxID=2908205 RepID=A0ABT0RQX6_9SPHN|nr:polysaccharide biosynthesis/export family protein [Sphingomonas caseinilyticus]MCL6697311.1 polysaccharide export protein [Sphingomonas caseinilyticus]